MKLFKTTNLQNVHSVCNEALSQARVLCVTGDRGQGRTVALKQFHKMHPEHSLYQEFRQGSTCKDFIKVLLGDISKTSSLYSAYELTCDLTRELSDTSIKLLIIDDFDLELLTLVQQLNSSNARISIVVSFDSKVFSKLKRIQDTDPIAKLLVSKTLLKLSPPRKDEIKEIVSTMGVPGDEIEAVLKSTRSFRHLQYQITRLTSISA